MRAFRKLSALGGQWERVLFLAPIAMALAALFLFTQNKELFAASWRSPVAVMTDRSPGLRDAGALYNTKPQRIRPVMAEPVERVLPGVRERLLPVDAPGETPLALTLPSPAIVVPEGPAPLLSFGEAPPQAFTALPPSTSSCCGTTTTTTAVPEPSTWLMNILGLFAVGGAMRYRNRKLREGGKETALPING